VRDLRGPLANQQETLPNDWKYVQFEGSIPKFWGLPQKIAENCAKYAAVLTSLDFDGKYYWNGW